MRFTTGDIPEWPYVCIQKELLLNMRELASNMIIWLSSRFYLL